MKRERQEAVHQSDQATLVAQTARAATQKAEAQRNKAIEKLQCMLCFDAERNVVFYPCGHRATTTTITRESWYRAVLGFGRHLYQIWLQNALGLERIQD